MDTTLRRHLVISAVNIRKGGTLTVLRDCLAYLSTRDDLRVTAIVHDRQLCRYPGIDYVDIPWSIKGWLRRLWCEYVTLGRLSRQLPEADLWLSLHDTTPRVRARCQAVYCQTSFPFLKILPQDWRMDPKIPLFALLTQYAYRIGVCRNRYLIVQQQWLREGLAHLLGLDEQRFIVAPPHFAAPAIPDTSAEEALPIFFYPASPDCHKNFETLCEAARLLEERLGKGRFRLLLSVSGTENRYAAFLKRRFGEVGSIEFCGYLSREELYRLYSAAACLVFPSRVETWGLPISEFLPSGKPMILSDAPYAREAAAGASRVAFFPLRDPFALSAQMELVIQRNLATFVEIKRQAPAAPYAPAWADVFSILLDDESTASR